MLEVPGRSLREHGRAALAWSCQVWSSWAAACRVWQAVLSREAPVGRGMTEQGCRAWGRPARTGWRCRREGWRPVWAGLADAGAVLGRRRLCTGLALPSFGAGADGMSGPGCRGDRTGAGTPGDRTDSAPPGPEESRQGRTARVAAWGLRHGGPGVRQSVIRTLEGGGGGRGAGGTRGVELRDSPTRVTPHRHRPAAHPPACPASPLPQPRPLSGRSAFATQARPGAQRERT